ncbi:hypothetical protein Tco_0885293 [Tanacetum coccineum]
MWGSSDRLEDRNDILVRYVDCLIPIHKFQSRVNGWLYSNSSRLYNLDSRKNTSVEASRNKMANNENLSGSYVYAVKKGTLNNDKEKEMKS